MPSLVSILVSKNAGKYRIQSNSLSALYYIAQELETRLIQKLSKQTGDSDSGNNDSIISCNDNVPFDEFFCVIELHFQTRLYLIKLLSQLNDRSHQFRMIEKRLLIRFKDRNPSSLAGIDIIMRESYDSLMKLGK